MEYARTSHTGPLYAAERQFAKKIVKYRDEKGVVTFEYLKDGATVAGEIKNVVDFGAFVDLGIKETALVHISDLSDGYVKELMAIVKAG